MSTDSKKDKRNKKFRVNNLEKFGFEVGKIYKFNGKYRKIYQTSNMYNTSFHERLSSYKIHKGEHVVFFDAKIWRASSVKRKFVKSSSLEKTKQALEAKGYKIIKVEPYSIQKFMKKQLPEGSVAKHYYISYCNSKEKYSGRLYIGHGDKFGWINIVQLEQEQIISQFEKITI